MSLIIADARVGDPPIGEVEILAAIRADRDDGCLLRSDEARRILVRLSDGQRLPEGSVCRDVETLVDLGGRYVYDVRETFLLIPISGKGDLKILIRKRFVRSRSLFEEIDRLECVIASAPAEPGLYRIGERVQELRDRSTADQ
jgi:hypothetical protein